MLCRPAWSRIDFLADQEPGASGVAQELARGRLATTVITRFELLSGARSAKQEKTLRADCAAAVRRALERRGQDIGMANSLIAGIVLTEAGALLTRNVCHFDRVRDLTLARLEAD